MMSIEQNNLNQALTCYNQGEFFMTKVKIYVSVAAHFLSQVIFVFVLFLGMVMHANEVETKEK